LEESHNPDAAMRRIADLISGRIDDLAVRIAERVASVPVYGDFSPEFHRDLILATARDALPVILFEQRKLSASELGAFRDAMRDLLSAGVPAQSMTETIYLAVPAAWDFAREVVREHDLDDGLFNFAALMFDNIHVFLQQVWAAERELAALRSEDDRQRRTRFLQALLVDGDTSAMTEHGLSLDARYHVFCARASEPADYVRLEETVRDTARAHGRVAVAGLLAGDLVGVTPTLPASFGSSTTVGLGPHVLPEELTTSYVLASRALKTAVAFSRFGAFTLEDLGAYGGVAADPELGSALAERYIAPLDAAAVQTAASLEDTLRAFLEHQLRVEPTARALGIHPNTLRHRLERFQQLTGTDVTSFDQLVALWWALKHREMQGLRPASTART
jgi:hypothetical protein